MPRRPAPLLPPLVYAQASPVSPGGRSLFGVEGHRAREISAFCSEQRVVASAARLLREAGFRVLHESPTTINIAAPAIVYQQAFGVRLAARREASRTGDVRIRCSGDDMPGLIPTRNTRLAGAVEGVAIEERVELLESASHPTAGSAPRSWAVRREIDRGGGSGVRVALVDTGWQAHAGSARRRVHPARVIAGPGAGRADRDEDGHGTAMVSALFAAAPAAEVHVVKMRSENALAALNSAIDLGPAVISCSWGLRRDGATPRTAIELAVEAALARAAARGIVAVFATGPDSCGFPSRHPEVIGARARRAPDGRSAEAASAVAPQVAGACAVILGCDPTLTPGQVRSALRATAAGPTDPGPVDARTALACAYGCVSSTMASGGSGGRFSA